MLWCVMKFPLFSIIRGKYGVHTSILFLHFLYIEYRKKRRRVEALPLVVTRSYSFLASLSFSWEVPERRLSRRPWPLSW